MMKLLGFVKILTDSIEYQKVKLESLGISKNTIDEILKYSFKIKIENDKVYYTDNYVMVIKF